MSLSFSGYPWEGGQRSCVSDLKNHCKLSSRENFHQFLRGEVAATKMPQFFRELQPAHMEGGQAVVSIPELWSLLLWVPVGVCPYGCLFLDIGPERLFHTFLVPGVPQGTTCA